MSNYMTDYFAASIDSDYEGHDMDGDLRLWWGNFCAPKTSDNEDPTWRHTFMKDYINEILENTDGFHNLPENLQYAMFKEIDIDYLLRKVQHLHREWYLEQPYKKDDEEDEEAEEADDA